ncbi:MAG: hypothetical protein R2823_10570 [Acidimicrobiia bacterium]
MLPAAVAIHRAGLAVDPDEFADVSFEVMPRWLRRISGAGIEGISVARRVFVTEEVFEQVVLGQRPDIVAHELVHTAQWADGGLGFWARYVGEYAGLRLLGLSHGAAYRGISYEVDAQRVASEHL